MVQIYSEYAFSFFFPFKIKRKLQWTSPCTQEELYPLITDLACPVNGAVISPFWVRAAPLPRTPCWHSLLLEWLGHRLKGGEALPSDTCTPLGLHLPPAAGPYLPAHQLVSQLGLLCRLMFMLLKSGCTPRGFEKQHNPKGLSLLSMPSQVPWHSSCSQTVNRNRLKYLFLLPMPFSPFRTKTELWVDKIKNFNTDNVTFSLSDALCSQGSCYPGILSAFCFKSTATQERQALSLLAKYDCLTTKIEDEKKKPNLSFLHLLTPSPTKDQKSHKSFFFFSPSWK